MTTHDGKELRWPTRGDRLLKKSRDWANYTRFEADGETRHHYIWDGNMRAGALLVDSCENDRNESTTLVYPILFNYRHAIELALKWIIGKFGPYASVEAGDYEHHNLWKLWCLYKGNVLELGSDDGDTPAVVEQVSQLRPAHGRRVPNANRRSDPSLRRAQNSGRAVQTRGHALPEALRGPRDLPRTHRPIECLTNMRASGEASTAQTHTRRASVNSVSSPQ